jgi:hypothetical protein
VSLRRCGKRFATEEQAQCSKRAQRPGSSVLRCRYGCGGFHVEEARKPRACKRRTGPKPFPKRVAAKIDGRDRCCQRCGSPWNLHRHHRRAKGIGGSQRRPHAQCACNGILLCAPCHMWVHRDGRHEAEAQGFVVSQSVDEPGSVGVMRFAGAGTGGATQWPSCGGEWAATGAEALEAVA